MAAADDHSRIAETKNDIEEMRLELSKSNALREKAREKLLKQRTQKKHLAKCNNNCNFKMDTSSFKIDIFLLPRKNVLTINKNLSLIVLKCPYF